MKKRKQYLGWKVKLLHPAPWPCHSYFTEEGNWPYSPNQRDGKLYPCKVLARMAIQPRIESGRVGLKSLRFVHIYRWV